MRLTRLRKRQKEPDFFLQQLNQFLAPGACLPEHLQGLIEGSLLAAGAVAARLLRSSTAGP